MTNPVHATSENRVDAEPLTGVVPRRGAQTSAPLSPCTSVKALFVITCPADPALLPSVIAAAAKLGHVPLRVYASRESGDGSELTIDLRLAGVSALAAHEVELALRAIAGIGRVFTAIEQAA